MVCHLRGEDTSSIAPACVRFLAVVTKNVPA
jgi:hypothetical protein